jgi:hypothetical protein
MKRLPKFAQYVLTRGESQIAVSYTCGDMMSIQADALIMAIKPEPPWHDFSDAILLTNQFCRRLELCPRKPGQAIVLPRRKKPKHGVGFVGDVVVVIDDPDRPLSKIVLTGLRAADVSEYKSVTMPMMRMDAQKEWEEGMVRKVIDQMVRGVFDFLRSEPPPQSLMSIALVVEDESTEGLLKEKLTDVVRTLCDYIYVEASAAQVVQKMSGHGGID